jgi:ABC-type glycerol-3-phosphate transport system substrate-binding protein
MRAIILIAAAALGLAACGKTGQAGNNANVDAGLTAESAVSNDVTAIDAVTGEDANMAADVNFINESDLTGNPSSNDASATRKRPQPRSAPAPATTNAVTEPATNNVL